MDRFDHCIARNGAQLMRPKTLVFLLTILAAILVPCGNVQSLETKAPGDSGGGSVLQPTGTPFPPGFPTPEPEMYSTCLAQGGCWEVLGLSGLSCNLPTMDDGKFCTDSDDCESACLADPDKTMKKDENGHLHFDHDRREELNSSGIDLTGTCSQWRENFGCRVWVDNGRYLDICVD